MTLLRGTIAGCGGLEGHGRQRRYTADCSRCDRRGERKTIRDHLPGNRRRQQFRDRAGHRQQPAAVRHQNGCQTGVGSRDVRCRTGRPRFGRNFDLAQLGWTTGRQNPCFLFSSSEIPTAKNNWLGTKFGGVNITGYSSTTYDQACQTYLSAGLDKDLANQANQQALTQLANDVPFIPLFSDQSDGLRADLCGLTLDVSSRSGLKDIEKLDIGTTCSK